MADPAIDNLNREISGTLQDIADILSRTKVDPATLYAPERKESIDVLQKLGEQLSKFPKFSEDMIESTEEFKKIVEEYDKIQRRALQARTKEDINKEIKNAQKIDRKLDSTRKMNNFLAVQRRWHDEQMGILKGILDCCLKGSTLAPSTPSAVPSSAVPATATSDLSEDATTAVGKFFKKLFPEKGGEFERIFGIRNKTLSEVLFGDSSPIRGIGSQIRSISAEMLMLTKNGSVLQTLTGDVVKNQIEYEKGIRAALFETAGATRESTKLFKVMSDIQGTVEITGRKQEEVTKALVKLSRTGIRYDGDSEKYKKRILGLTLTTLNTEKLLGFEAGELLDKFGDLYRFGVLNQNAIANLGRGMQEVARTTGISGEALKKVLSISDAIVDSMRKASTLTSSSAKNIIELAAGAQKFGVSEEIAAITKAAGSTVNLFKEASDGTRLLLFNAAAAVGKLDQLQTGTLLRSKEGVKSLSEGINKVFRQFGIESADAIDSLSDAAKMRLNLVLSSSFNLELGQVKGILKTLDLAGKTLADKLIDLDKQLQKNISLEKRTALIEEQRKLRSEAGLNILNVLSESAETAKTMDEAFQRFGKRRNEFESDLRALGLGGSNKDVIREAIQQSLTSVNAALSKSGLEQISFTAEEMTKALQDPQAFQDLLGRLDVAQQKTRATGNAQLDAISETNNQLAKLTEVVQNQIAKPLNMLLSSGGVAGVIATEIGILLGPSIASAIGSSLKFLPAAIGRMTGRPTLPPSPTPIPSPTPTPLPPLPKGSFKDNMLQFGGKFAKFATGLVLTGALIFGGLYLIHKFGPKLSNQDIELVVDKAKSIGIAIGAASLILGELYLASLALKGISSLNISWTGLAKGGAILLAGSVAIPAFLLAVYGIIKAVNFITGINLNDAMETSKQIGGFLLGGAAILTGLAASLAVTAGTGYLAKLLANPAGIKAALLTLGTGAAVLVTAAAVIPTFIQGIYEIVSASMNLFGLNPARMEKGFNNFLNILTPFAKIIGLITAVGASIAGAAVGGIFGAAVGGIAYGLGALGSLFGAGANFGNVNDLVKDVLDRSFALMKITIDSIEMNTGALTPAKVETSLKKLESFGNIHNMLGSILSFYAKKFEATLPAYIAIAKISNDLRYTGSTTPDDVANKFRSLSTIIEGVAKITPELDASTKNLSETQIKSVTSFMEVFSKTALPLFTSLASIDTIVRSDSFKTVNASKTTFEKTSKILENVAPYLKSVMLNIQFVSKTLYENIKDTPIEQLKVGAETSASIISLFSTFVDSVKKTSGNLKPKDMEEFQQTFGSNKMIDSLRSVILNTAKLADIFGTETRSGFELKYIADNMKNYSEFYASVGGLLKNYSEIKKLINPKEVQYSLGSGGGVDYTGVAKDIGNAKVLIEDETRIKTNLIGALNLLRIFAEAATDPKNIGDFNKLSEAEANLKDLSDASVSLGVFLSAFNTNVLEKISSSLEMLKDFKYSKRELGQTKDTIFQGNIGLGVLMDDLIFKLNLIVVKFGEGAKNLDLSKLNESNKKIILVVNSLNTLFDAISNVKNFDGMNKIIDFVNNLPTTKPTDIKDKFDNLKLYLDEINKITKPDFMSSIQAISKIGGITIESNTESAIRLISSLTSFITNIQNEFGKLDIKKPKENTVGTTIYDTFKKESPFSQEKLNSIKTFLEKEAIPAIEQIEAISIKLSKMQINESLVNNAAKKLESFSVISGSLNKFYETLFIFTKNWTAVPETKGMVLKPELIPYLPFVDEFDPNNFIETTIKGKSELEKAIDMLSSAETKKLFEILAKIPKFYNDNILKPFQESGGFRLNLGAVNFISNSLIGITKIMDSLFSREGILRKIQTYQNFTKIGKDGKTQLTNIKNVLDDFGKDNLFLNLIASLMSNIILPAMGAARVAGGPAALAAGVKSTEEIINLINKIPVLIKTSLAELSKLGTVTNPKSDISKAKNVIDQMKDPFPKLLKSLTENIVIPSLVYLLPKSLIEQASKRLGSASDLVQKLQPFLASYAQLDLSLGSTLEKLTLVSCLNNLMKNIDPVEGNLSKFSDKLILVKDHLESIAESMTSIAGLRVEGNIFDVLNKVGEIPEGGIKALQNLGSTIGTVTTDIFDSIKNKLQIELIKDKNSAESEKLDQLNKKEEQNLQNQKSMLAALGNIYNALVSAGVVQPTPSGTVSKTGKLGIEKVTGNGTASTGNPLNSSSVQATNLSPTVGR